MRDVEHADAEIGGSTNRREQLGAFDVGERRCRLVEHEQARFHRQGAGEQGHRPLDRAQRRGVAADVDVDVEALMIASTRRRSADHLHEPEPLRRAVAEHHVLGDRQSGDDGQLLVQGGDAVALGVVRIAERPDGRADRDRPAVGLHHPGDDLDQRRLTGAVLAEQGMHFAGGDAHADAVAAPADVPNDLSIPATSSAATSTSATTPLSMPRR